MQTKPTADQIIELEDEDSDDLRFIEGRDEVEGKYVSDFTVYEHLPTGTFWEIHEVSTNSGYWSDSEQISKDAYEVNPVKKMVEVTEWHAV